MKIEILEEVGFHLAMKGLATGIATGKAVEAATGVTPVFVTNWPGGGYDGTPAPAGGSLPDGAKPVAGAGADFCGVLLQRGLRRGVPGLAGVVCTGV